ncbi:MAG: hypothetical protein RSB71_01125 [Bacilli bacterium]
MSFMNIMRVMNNGLNNESTLVMLYPMITKLCLEKKPEQIGNVIEWMLGEEVLSKPHPGLNDIVGVCKGVVTPSIEQVRVR